VWLNEFHPEADKVDEHGWILLEQETVPIHLRPNAFPAKLIETVSLDLYS
jgi:hypothetical protein